MQKKDKYTIEDLQKIMTKLRAKDGCPWDRVQTHDSIKYCAVEEAWEVVDAIDQKDDAMLKNELGDLLMQVVFHAEIGREDNSFSFDDVVYEICHKLITRHSHVFGNDRARNAEDVLNIWDKNKEKEKNIKSYTELLEDVPKSFPALLRAQKVSKRAAKAGFDWDSLSGAMAKLEEEISELKEAIACAGERERLEEFGDLLFAAANVARFLETDGELALNKATDKFIRRFSAMEKLAKSMGKELDVLSLDKQEDLWQKVKLHEAETK